MLYATRFWRHIELFTQKEALNQPRKVVISDQVYMRLTPEEHQQQVELLTFILPKQSPNQKFQPIQLQIKTISTAKQAYSFPSGHIDTIIGMCKRVTGQGCQFEFIDRTSKVPQKIPDPLFVLRESQSMAMEQFLNHPKIEGFQLNGVINAIPG